MRICGIDIAGKDLILVMGAHEDDGNFQITASKKISVTDSDDAAQLRSIRETVDGVLRENKIELVGIKVRPTKGKFAAGPTSHKLEAIVQLNDVCDVVLVHPQTMKAVLKNADSAAPLSLKKYHADAFEVAMTLAVKEGQ